MSRHNINIQDGFLFQSLKEAREMVFELITGKILEGRLKRFDRFAVVIDTGEREVLVYKHAIATIFETGDAASPPRERTERSDRGERVDRRRY